VLSVQDEQRASSLLNEPALNEKPAANKDSQA